MGKGELLTTTEGSLLIIVTVMVKLPTRLPTLNIFISLKIELENAALLSHYSIEYTLYNRVIDIYWTTKLQQLLTRLACKISNGTRVFNHVRPITQSKGKTGVRRLLHFSSKLSGPVGSVLYGHSVVKVRAILLLLACIVDKVEAHVARDRDGPISRAETLLSNRTAETPTFDVSRTLCSNNTFITAL